MAEISERRVDIDGLLKIRSLTYDFSISTERTPSIFNFSHRRSMVAVAVGLMELVERK